MSAFTIDAAADNLKRSVAHGKLDARIELPGACQKEMKVSIVGTERFSHTLQPLILT